MEKTLKALEAILIEKKQDLIKDLQSPVTEENLKKIEDELGYILPNSIKTMFFWKNGVSENSELNLEDLWLSPYEYFLMPLEECLSVYKELMNDEKDMASEIGDGHIWKENQFPFADCGNGDVLFIVCDKKPIKDSEIFEKMSGDEPVKIASSLSEYFQNVLKAYS